MNKGKATGKRPKTTDKISREREEEMKKPLRVLIVEDSEEDTLLIARELKRGGFDPIHERVETAEAMKAALSKKTWDLMLADYSMPHFSGLEALKLLKESGLDIPFIIVSGSIGEDTAVAAMKAGANDYLMKNKLARLVPAIEQELREAEVRRKLRESQNALQESEKRYRQVVENATEIIYTVDEKGNFTYANPTGLKVTGYSLEELRRFNYMDLVVPEHRERVTEIYINQLRQRIPTTHVEFPFLNKAGGITWFSQNASLVIEEGKVVGFHIIARDVTERKKVEQALAESERRYRNLVENAPDVIFTLASDGTIASLNPAFERITGWSRAEWLHKQFTSILHPDDLSRGLELFEHVLKGEETAPFEFRVLNKSGDYLTAEFTVTPQTQHGSVIGILGIARDISERKGAEEALRWSEETARALLNATTDSVFLIDSGGSVLALNEMAAKRLNARVDEMLGACLYDFLPSDLAKRRKTRFDEVFRTGKPVYFEDERQGIWFDNCVYPISDVSGKVMKLAIYGRDVTEQKRTEEALQKSEEKYRTILEAIEEGYYEVDLNGNFTFFNDSLCRMLGYTRAELMSMNNRQYMDKETARKVYEVFSRLYATGEPYEAFDWEITRKDGTKRFHDSSVSLIRNAQGECIGFRGIARDVTQRKQAEERLRLQSAALEAAANAIIITNREGMIEWANPSFTMLTGYSDKEVVGRNPRGLIKSGEQNQAFYKDLWDTILAGKVWRGQIINRRKGGSLYTEEMTITPLPNERGEISRFIAIKQDITERKRAEEALRESEERFRELYDGAPVGYHEYDSEGRITRVNRTDLEMLGYTAEEMIGQPIWKFNVGEEIVRQQVLEKLSGLRPPGRGLERAYKRKDGTTFPVLIEDRLIRDEKGKITGIRVTIQDITDRKRADEALRQAEERYRSIFENAVEGIFQSTPEGRYISANPAQAQMLGYESPEDLMKSITDIAQQVFAESDRRQEFNRLLDEHGVVKGFEFQASRKDGSNIWISSNVRAVRDATGGVIYYEGTAEDITERKRAEGSLKQSEENARQLAQENAIMAEIGRIISSTLDIDEVYEGFSGEVKKIIPFNRIVINIIDTEKGTVKNVYMAGKKVQDRNVKDIYPLEGSGNAEMVRTKSTLLIQAEDFSQYEDRFPMLLSTFQAGFRSIMNVPLFSKGKIIGGLLLRSHKPFTYSDKDVRLAERIASQIAGAIANAQLYTERIQAEEERGALQEQLRQSQKMEAIGRLAGGVSHDFNNLLTVIKGYSQLSLAEIKGDNPLRENVEEIRKAADRAADLTRQLLAFSRRQIMEMRVLDLNAHVQNLDKMLRRLIGEDIELVSILAEDLGRVKTDPGQMEQMIMNLAINARDAMLNGGKLTIETANVELDQAYARAHVAVTPGRYIMVSVSDTGVGMAPEVRDRVFEPFFTTKEKGKGTGLGLSTVYGIVKQSGGNIWVYSEPGKGTTFKIYLPRVEEPLEALKEKIVGRELPQGSETIFIVEDEGEVLKLAGRLLRRQGYHVLEASNGEEALRVCKGKKEPFHLLLTDVVMPQMGGRQLAEQLKQVCQDFKVLYMSGYTDNAITHHGVLEKGMNYLQKPFTVDSLARKVREVLDK